MSQDTLWLFGYGSLIWRPDFEYLQKRVAAVDGWSRRFWQGSHDHRGVPEAPGRVVTMVRMAEERCVGMAFQIAQAQADEIFDQLDYREKNGYQRLELECMLDNGELVTGLTYVAGEGNEAYLGAAPAAEIARQIQQSCGPSGSNRDYLLELASALRGLGISDRHVFELEKLVLGGI